jgi:hypothetical protein
MMPTSKTLITSGSKKARKAIAVFCAQYDNAGLDNNAAQQLNESKSFATELLVLIKRHSVKQPEFPDVNKWIDFYRRYFNKDVDFTSLHVPQKPNYECWPIVIVPSLISNNDAFDACKKAFAAWRYQDDLNTVRNIVSRPTVPYVVWVRATVEADSDLANVSAEQILERKLSTITLLERLILEEIASQLCCGGILG